MHHAGKTVLRGDRASPHRERRIITDGPYARVLLFPILANCGCQQWEQSLHVNRWQTVCDRAGGITGEEEDVRFACAKVVTAHAGLEIDYRLKSIFQCDEIVEGTIASWCELKDQLIHHP